MPPAQVARLCLAPAGCFASSLFCVKIELFTMQSRVKMGKETTEKKFCDFVSERIVNFFCFIKK